MPHAVHVGQFARVRHAEPSLLIECWAPHGYCDASMCLLFLCFIVRAGASGPEDESDAHNAGAHALKSAHGGGRDANAVCS